MRPKSYDYNPSANKTASSINNPSITDTAWERMSNFFYKYKGVISGMVLAGLLYQGCSYVNDLRSIKNEITTPTRLESTTEKDSKKAQKFLIRYEGKDYTVEMPEEVWSLEDTIHDKTYTYDVNNKKFFIKFKNEKPTKLIKSSETAINLIMATGIDYEDNSDKGLATKIRIEGNKVNDKNNTKDFEEYTEKNDGFKPLNEEVINSWRYAITHWCEGEAKRKKTEYESAKEFSLYLKPSSKVEPKQSDEDKKVVVESKKVTKETTSPTPASTQKTTEATRTPSLDDILKAVLVNNASNASEDYSSAMLPK